MIMNLIVNIIHIVMPAWVEHGVSEVNIVFNYYDGYGRYAITHFLGVRTKQITVTIPCTGGF